MARVPTLASHDLFVSRVLDVQERVQRLEQQIGTEKRSNDYAGIAVDSFRLVNLETERTKAQSFIRTNEIAKVQVGAMTTAINSTEATMRKFREELAELASRDLSFVSDEEQLEIENLQRLAFESMRDLEFYMNTKVDGRFLFAGGKTTTEAVDIGFETLEQFQARYDGERVTYATTRTAHLFNASFDETDTGDLTLTNGPGTDEGTIAAATAGAFTLNTVTGAAGTTGNIAIDTATNTISATERGAFNSIPAGATIILGGASAGTNAGVYTVQGVSSDGRTLTLDSGTALAADATVAAGTGLTFEQTFALGTSITLDGVVGTSTTDYSETYTVVGVDSNQQIRVRTNGVTNFPAVADTVDSTTTNFTFESQSYYRGDKLQVQHRVEERLSLDLGINAEDGAIEKAMRAMGIMAQGNLIDPDPLNPDINRPADRIAQAIQLIDDALNHSVGVDEDPSDINALINRLGTNEVQLQRVINENESFVVFLENRIIEIENIDPTEAVVRLNNDLRSLEISYATLGRITKLSLINFI